MSLINENFCRLCSEGNILQVKKELEFDKKKKNFFISRIFMKTFGLFININHIEIFSGYTALHIACSYGHIDIVKLLLAVPEIDAGIKNSNNQNALEIICNNHYAHYLYDKNMIKIADVLLQITEIIWDSSIKIKCRCAHHLQIDKMIKKQFSKMLIGIIPLPYDIIYNITAFL